MPYYASTQRQPPLVWDSVLPCKMKACPSRAAWASQLAACLPACLLSALRLSSSPSSRPVPSSLSSSSPTSSPRSLPVLAAGLQTQPPDRELTWTLDTVPARLTRLFAQSRVDNSSSTITSAGADHVWNREGFNALTTDVGGGIPQSH